MIEMDKEQYMLFTHPGKIDAFSDYPDAVQLVILAAYDDYFEGSRPDYDVWVSGHKIFECLERQLCTVFNEDQQVMRAFVRAWLWLNMDKLEGWFEHKNRSSMEAEK